MTAREQQAQAGGWTPFKSALMVAALIGALSGAGIWYAAGTFDQGVLSWPALTVRHDPEDLAPGLKAYAARHGSPNHHGIVVKVKSGDIKPWASHFDNVAAHQGWYTTGRDSNSRNLIVPGGDLNILWDAKARPYRWLEEHRPPPGAKAQPLELGNYPAYVTFHVWQKTPVHSVLILVGCAVMIVLAVGIVLNAWMDRKG